MSDDRALIDVQRLTVRRRGVDLLSNVDLKINAREIITIVGPNGAGKSTLLRAAMGLIKPDGGTVRRQPGLTIGYLPQTLNVEPVLPLNVRRFLALGVQAPKGARAEVMEEVGVPHLIDRPLDELSGGELRRVMLARALLRQPGLLVLDEPLQGVDIGGQVEIYEMIASFRERHNLAVLMVSHDLHLVMAATDHVVCLNQHVCCDGSPDAVQRHPEYVALFGDRAAAGLAVYSHHHDHSHDAHGNVVATPHNHDHEHAQEHDHG